MVFKKEGWPFPVYTCNWQQHSRRNMNQRLKNMFNSGFDSIITTLFDDGQMQQLNLDNSCLPTQEVLQKGTYVRNIIIQVNKSINILRKLHRSIFKFIVGYAVYLGVHGILLHLPSLQDEEMKQYTAKLNKYIDGGLFGNLRVIISLGTWKQFQCFRRRLNFTKNIDFMIVASDLIDKQGQRWLAQKIEYIIFEDDCWTNNQKGHPVMTTKAAECCKIGIGHNITIVLRMKQLQLQEHNKFIHFLFNKMKLPSQREAETMRHYDVLQQPLQPYYHNLQAETYKIFQSDNPKYDQYEFALCKAFQKFSPESTITIFYIGSGRGQLIYSSMNAAKKTNRSIFIYAIEKNPYPIQSLKRRIKKNKWNNVEIVFKDIREWNPPKIADIFLSELLGGFGDNELSPQCLFWAEKHLTPKTVCIPQSYSAYCSPISCKSIHQKLGKSDRQKYYVVSLHNFYLPSDDVKKVWRFEHPIKSEAEFQRFAECQFIMKTDSTIHGFAGYFDCVLFDNNKLSTNPYEHTPDMHSWFPIYFAVQDEISAFKGDIIKIKLWRKFDKNKVWYEWQLKHKSGDVEAQETMIHNLGGLSIWIGK